MIKIINARMVLVAMALLLAMCSIASGAPVTKSITYQGKLTNAADIPLTGSYSLTFKLYDTSAGGTVLGTDTHSVTATNGLFTTPVAVDPTVLDGRALWLGVKVGADPEMTPRQEIRPVPYALALAGPPPEPVQYEYYSAPMYTLKTLSSMQDYTTVTNAGDNNASVCYYKYLKQGLGDFILKVSYCINLEAGKTRSCSPTLVANSTYQWRIKITTNSSYVVPYTSLIEGSGPTYADVYHPGDFTKVEKYS